MQLLSNICYLDQYLSPSMINKLVRAAESRMRNEMKMQFFQSRWVSVNLTTLARVFRSPKLSDNQKADIQKVSLDYAKLLISKLKITKEREDSSINDLASITYQLKKLQLNKIADMSEIFIFLENSLLNSQ